MCGDGQSPKGPSLPAPDTSVPFPWEAGAYDAHCHPTDTMSSIASIPEMKARTLTIMATRSQDQDLVSSVASDLAVKSKGDLAPSSKAKVIPSFGWHPWFAHQILDDTDDSTTLKAPPQDATPEQIQEVKRKHYSSVLSPPPTDPDFIAQLPTPTSLSTFLDDTRSRVTAHPVALVGEIGLDKAFRLPEKWASDSASERDPNLTPGGREGRRLSPHTVVMSHQIAVLQAQLKLAGALRVPVSVHGVQAHGVLYDAVSACWKGFERDVMSKRERRQVAPNAEDWSSGDEDSDSDSDGEGGAPVVPEKKPAKEGGAAKPFPPRICLHSFSGSVEVLKRYVKPQVPATVFFSVSTAINLGTASGAGKFAEIVRAIPDDRILAESDLHLAGGDMDAALEDIYRRVCEVKGWGLEDGVRRIAKNFEAFVFG